MTAPVVKIAGLDDLIGLQQRYLTAVADGHDELVIELPRATLGIDGAGSLAGVHLASVSAPTIPAIDVVLRAPEPPCVLVDLPLHVAARDVTIEGVALVAGPSPSLSVTATRSVALRDVAVLGALATGPDENDPAAVLLHAAPNAGPSLSAAQLVVANSAADGALLGLRCGSGAWWENVDAEDACLVAHGPVAALVAVDAVRRLALRDCTLVAGGSGAAAIGALWPPIDAELAGCRVDVADPFALLSVRQKTPKVPPPTRLAQGTGVTFAPARVPFGLAADDSVVEVAPDAVRAAAAATVERTIERLVAVDARLAGRLGT